MYIFQNNTPVICYTGRENQELDIVLFHEVLDHIARFDRVLTSPGGSLLLSGRSGVGRRTALLLTAHMHQLDIVTPHISRNYGLKQFKNDLKNVSFQVAIYVHIIYIHIHVLGFQYTFLVLKH